MTTVTTKVNNMKEYIITIGYPFFLENEEYRVFADDAKTAVEIVFRKVSSKALYSIEEYTGIKHYAERCFNVHYGLREIACFYLEEI